MVPKLSEAEIRERLGLVSGWVRVGDVIRKTFQLASFPAAIAFVTHVGFLAEAAAHHPDIDVRWRSVTLVLTTHDAQGLSYKDFEFAAQVDAMGG